MNDSPIAPQPICSEGDVPPERSLLSVSRLGMLLLANLALCGITFFGAWAAQFYTFPGRNESLVYFPAGIALGFLFRCRYETLPGIYLGIALYNWYGYKLSLGDAFLEAVDTIIACGVAAWCMQRVGVGRESDPSPRRDLFYFYLFGVALAPLISTLVSFPIHWMNGLVSPTEDFRIHGYFYLLGDSFAIMVVAPTILLFGRNVQSYYHGPKAVYGRSSRREKWIWTATSLTLLLVTGLFGDRILYAGVQDVLFLLYPLLAWSAIRLGVVFTNVALYFTCLSVFTFKMLGLGGTPVVGTIPEILRVTTFIVTISVMAQALSVESLERRRRQVKIEFDAVHDSETNLGNVRALRQCLMETARVQQTHGDSPVLPVACMSMDHYSTLVLSFGFEARNTLLREFGEYLTRNLPETVTAFRVNGAEFILTFSQPDWDTATREMASLVEHLPPFIFTWQDRQIRMGNAIGLIAFDCSNEPSSPDMMELTDRIIADAQDAAWQARNQRQALLIVREPSPETLRRRSRAVWLSDLQDALTNKRFTLVAQPIVRLGCEEISDEPVHFEVLVRLLQSNGEPLKPGAFLPVAEELGLMADIDLYVLAATLQWLCEHPQERERIALCSVNISAYSLTSPGFTDAAVKLVQASGVPATQVGFELLENVALAHLEYAQEFIAKTRALGCRISLDDFGAGVSSFAYLKSLSVDYVKIDGSFVQNLVPNSTDYAIIDAVQRVSQQIQVQTVAEWVTTLETQTVLTDMGINFGQGHLFGEPVTFDELFREGMSNSLTVHE